MKSQQPSTPQYFVLTSTMLRTFAELLGLLLLSSCRQSCVVAIPLGRVTQRTVPRTLYPLGPEEWPSKSREEKVAHAMGRNGEVFRESRV